MASPRMTVAHRRHELFRKAVGDVLQKARWNAGATLDQVSAETGMHKSTIAGLERGEASLTLTAVMDVLFALDAPQSTFDEIVAKDAALRLEVVA